MRFAEQVVVVTGASRGIGREIAEQFARDGATVACFATKKENAQATVDTIIASGGKAAAFGAPASDAEAIQATIDQVVEQFGRLDVLVNNAGITRDTLIMRMKDEDWDDVIAVNLKGTYLACKAACRVMMKQRYGRIVNISSIVGLSGAAGQANYAASKAGVIGLTLALAKELGSRGITVNAVAPGFIETDMTSDLSEEMRESVKKTAPLGRLGTPQDIAPAVCFLASKEAGYITGQTLVVDGGLIL